MKKVKVLGKTVPVLVLVLLGVGMVSAALVGYLSNKTTAEVTVSSPIEQLISDGSGWTDAPISFTSYGGESVTFYMMDANLADVPITGTVENIVTNPDGVTCDDFVSVIVTTTTKIGGVVQSVSGPHDLILYNSVAPVGRFCNNTAWNKVTFSYGPDPLTLVVGQEDTSDIAVTFKTDALGTYTFTSQIVPV